MGVGDFWEGVTVARDDSEGGWHAGRDSEGSLGAVATANSDSGIGFLSRAMPCEVEGEDFPSMAGVVGPTCERGGRVRDNCHTYIHTAPLKYHNPPLRGKSRPLNLCMRVIPYLRHGGIF